MCMCATNFENTRSLALPLAAKCLLFAASCRTVPERYDRFRKTFPINFKTVPKTVARSGPVLPPAFAKPAQHLLPLELECALTTRPHSKCRRSNGLPANLLFLLVFSPSSSVLQRVGNAGVVFAKPEHSLPLSAEPRSRESQRTEVFVYFIDVTLRLQSISRWWFNFPKLHELNIATVPVLLQIKLFESVVNLASKKSALLPSPPLALARAHT